MKKTFSKKTIFLLGALFFLAFFVYTEPFFIFKIQNAYAFGHPDAISPNVEITEPDIGTPFNQAPPTISYDAADSYGTLSGCAVYFKDTKASNSWTLGTTNASCREGENELSTIGSWCNSEGSNACGISIEAKDSAGNTSRDERFFTIDKTPPVIEISSNRSHPTQKTNVEFKFSASDAYGIERVQCVVDAPGETLEDCIWRKTYTRLPDGLREFTVVATDKAGNTASKKLVWEIDSTPPAAISDIFKLKIRESESTYFSQLLEWIAPREDGHKGGISAQYDIRYSAAPINETNWNDTTALVYRESQPKPHGSAETMTVGPNSEIDLEEPRRLGLLSKFNSLSANTEHYFALKTRDEKWNWSAISSASAWTDRDPCDYDGDRLYSPKDGCGPRKCDPTIQTCDLYDNPYDWGLPNDPHPYDWGYSPGRWPYENDDKPDDFWINAFGATIKDLDQDGEVVANERIGMDLRSLDMETLEEPRKVTGYPSPGGIDWYDNPFTAELFPLAKKPLLKQLSYTINDLDLDTFVSKDWDQRFAGAEKTDTDLDDKFNADIVLEEGNNVAGCIYPGAREGTCFDCTAYNPDPATGRVPAEKNKPTISKNRAVCQIEAYYTDLQGKYKAIEQGMLEPGKDIVAASANCRDGLDNNLEGGTDSSDDPRDPGREVNCPTTFGAEAETASRPVSEIDAQKESNLAAAIFPRVGLVQCGRHADDYRTPIDESANCNICHLFYLLFSLINLLISRLMPFLVAVSFVVGGLLMAISRGVPERIVQGKKLILWSVSAYALMLLVWALLTIFFALIGAAKWSGLTPEKGTVSAISELTLTDTSKNWEEDEWKNYFVEIQPAKEDSIIRKVAKNTKDTVTLMEAQPFALSADSQFKYNILNTSWWSFVCKLGQGVTADFSASPDSGNAPFEVEFTDLSSAGATSWHWDFRDGTTSSEQSPRHRYTTNGPHTVVLIVEGEDGSSRKEKIIYHEPTAEFTSMRTHGRTPLNVKFTDSSTGGIDSWSWDFDGDGVEDSDKEEPLIFTYTKPGPYRVKLTVSGPGGRDVMSKLNYIFAYPAPPEPIADFSASIVPGDFLTLETQNLSFEPRKSTLDDITAWEWDFGNGKDTSAVENPTYFYETSTEPYELTLNAIGPGGENSASTTVSFAPEANFSANVTSATIPQTGVVRVQFTDNSTGTVSGWEWNFGDCARDPAGCESSQSSPSHDYKKDGLYAVTLTAKGPLGENTKTVENYIALAPRADFDYLSAKLSDLTKSGDCRSSCTVGPSGVTVTFSSNNSNCAGPCTSYWEFGDEGSGATKTVAGLGPVSYIYNNKSEVFTVRLTVTGPGGSNTVERKDYIKVAPWAVITPKEVRRTHRITLACGENLPPDWPPPTRVTFEDKSQPQPYIKTRSWSNGETGHSTTQEFKSSGNMTLTATNAHGQSDSATSKVIISRVINRLPCPPAGGGG